MTTPHISRTICERLVDFWRQLHQAQIAYAVARVYADKHPFASFAKDEDPQVAIKEAEKWRSSIREALRQEYSAIGVDGLDTPIETYFTALDALYGQSGNLSFTLLAGHPGFDEALARRALARDAVNSLTQVEVLKTAYS